MLRRRRFGTVQGNGMKKRGKNGEGEEWVQILMSVMTARRLQVTVGLGKGAGKGRKTACTEAPLPFAGGGHCRGGWGTQR